MAAEETPPPDAFDLELFCATSLWIDHCARLIRNEWNGIVIVEPIQYRLPDFVVVRGGGGPCSDCGVDDALSAHPLAVGIDDRVRIAQAIVDVEDECQ